MKKVISIILAIVLVFSALAFTFGFILKDELKPTETIAPEVPGDDDVSFGETSRIRIYSKTYNGDELARLFGVNKTPPYTLDKITYSLDWDSESTLKFENIDDYVSLSYEGLSNDEVLVVCKKDFGDNLIYLKALADSGVSDLFVLSFKTFLTPVKIDTSSLTLDEYGRYILSENSDYSLPLKYVFDNYDGRFNVKTSLHGSLCFEISNNVKYTGGYRVGYWMYWDLGLMLTDINVRLNDNCFPTYSISNNSLNISILNFFGVVNTCFTNDGLLNFKPLLFLPSLENSETDVCYYWDSEKNYASSSAPWAIAKYNREHLPGCYILVEVEDTYTSSVDFIKVWVN